jgi:hypothetical protein
MMGEKGRSKSRRGGRGPKIERVAKRYSIPELGDDLVARWLGESSGEQQSLRDLAEYVNRLIVESALESSGDRVLDGEAENMYRLLTADEVTAGMQTEARQTLANKGIEINQLEADFVSYQAVYNYLRKHRDVSSEERKKKAQKPISADLESVQKLSSRLRAVLSGMIDKWEGRNAVTVDEYDVEVDVWISCQSCGERLRPAELVDRGGCRCDEVPEVKTAS